MRRKLTAVLAFCFACLMQHASAQVKVEGHTLGETAEQFFAEAQEGDVLRACSSGVFGKMTKSIKRTANETCGLIAGARQHMITDENGTYKGTFGEGSTKTTTYFFEIGVFVAAEIRFSAPEAINNFQGKSFGDIFNGLKQAYGPPASESVVPYKDSYGVTYQAHNALWIAQDYAIQLQEQPGPRGWTTVNAWTRQVYEKRKAAASTKAPLN